MTKGPILVATDLSACCDRAVDRALALATQLGLPIDLLHVIESSGEANEENVARGRAAALLPDHPSCEVLVERGSVPETIARVAEERGSTLIVTGVARLNSLGDYFLGTAVDHVVRTADVPVLVVKQRPRKPYITLMIATDLSACSRKAVTTSGDMFPDAVLHLIHAFHTPFDAWPATEEMRDEVQEEAQRNLEAFADDTKIPEAVRSRVRPRLGNGETGHVVAEAIRETGADLVVLGTHSKSGFVHATIGSTAESLLSWLTVDTMMIREPT